MEAKLEDRLWDAWKHHAKYFRPDTRKHLMKLMNEASLAEVEALVFLTAAFVNGVTKGAPVVIHEEEPVQELDENFEEADE